MTAQGSGYVSMARPPHLKEVVDPGNEPLLRAEVLHQADRAPAGPLHTLLKPFHLRHVGAAEAIDRLLGVADHDFSLYRVGYRMPRGETVEQEDA